MATYLSVDVPAWIRATLQVNPDTTTWAIGGLSNGGTCSLQMAVTAPDVYRTFVDLSGEAEPTLGDRAGTVAAAFGGDEAAFAAVNPLDVLADPVASRTPPGTWSPARRTPSTGRRRSACSTPAGPRGWTSSCTCCPAGTRSRCGGRG